MKNKALLVGINKYPNPSNELRGCINDILDMQHYISEKNKIYSTENIQILKDKQATKKNIQEKLNWLIEGVQPGDQLLFHYSGHGAQTPTLLKNEEPDGQDEIICPYDFDWSPSTTFRDKEFAAIFKKIPKGVHFVWISDSCHAEDLYRDPIPLDTTIQNRIQYRFFPNPDHTINDQPITTSNYISAKSNLINPFTGVLLSACESHQLSADAYIDARFNGAFTHYLLKQLSKNDNQTPLTEIIKQVNSELMMNGYDQRPQTEGPLSKASFFI